jgi:DNA-binding Lrp family transcriptional regulator
MKEDDVLKLRKIVEILRTEKKYSMAKIGKEIKLSEPTLKKLLEDDIAEMHVRASVLGLVQDFNKKHCEDLNYAGIEAAPETVVRKAVEKMKKEKKQTGFSPEDLPDFKSAEEFNHEVQETVYPEEGLKLFFESLGKAIPPNMTMTITINGK